MGETLPLFKTSFNCAVEVESRPEHLTGEAGALIQREVMDRLGMMDWLAERLTDSRDLLDAVLRPGQVGTAEGGLDFILTQVGGLERRSRLAALVAPTTALSVGSRLVGHCVKNSLLMHPHHGPLRPKKSN